MNGQGGTVSVLKTRLREEIRRRTDALSCETVRRSGEGIAEALFNSELWMKAESVFLYVSVRKEPDTGALLAAAFGEGKKVYVPKCLPASCDSPRRMLAVRIRSEEDLVPGPFGIPEPRACLPDPDDPEGSLPAEALDLILVPCVAASAHGIRLGHGGGYYDRFLADLPYTEKRAGGLFPATVCLCHEALLTEDIPATELDVRMDFVVTAEGIRDCR